MTISIIVKEIVKMLLPLTDEKYYLKAYQYCYIKDIRKLVKNIIREKNPHFVFQKPRDGFGGPAVAYRLCRYAIRRNPRSGPLHQMDIKYKTPPIDPIYLQIWSLLTKIDEDDPNKLLPVVICKQEIGGSTKEFDPNDSPFQEDDYLTFLIAGFFNRYPELERKAKRERETQMNQLENKAKRERHTEKIEN